MRMMRVHLLKDCMTVVIALDKKNGYTLFGKRLSQDRIVAKDILSSFPLIYMSVYSASQFDDKSRIVFPIPDNLPSDAVVFLETEDIPSDAEHLVVYRWDKQYPSDRKYNPAKFFWYKKHSEEFKGYSHEKIVKEFYEK